MNRAMAVVAAAVLALGTFSTQAEDRPYKEGPVTEVSSIKVKPGKFDEYMAYLAGPYRDLDRKSTRLNSSHLKLSRMPSSA